MSFLILLLSLWHSTGDEVPKADTGHPLGHPGEAGNDVPEHPHLFLLVVVLPLCSIVIWRRPPLPSFPSLKLDRKFLAMLNFPLRFLSGTGCQSPVLTFSHSSKNAETFTKGSTFTNKSSMFCKNSTHFSHSLVSGINSSAVTQHGHRSAAFWLAN